MALSTKVGSITQQTVTGNFSTTGVGFQPKLLILFGNEETADGSGANNTSIFGVAVSSTSRRCSFRSSTNGSSNVGFMGHHSDACYLFANATATVLCQLDLVSMDADGFTLNQVTTDATARVINYIAFGGADLTNVASGTVASPASTGNQATTGVGFQPDCLLFFTHRLDTTDNQIKASSGGFDAEMILGFATSSTAREVMGQRTANNPTINEYSAQIATKAISIYNEATTVLMDADLVSMDSDGFTLNWTTVSNGLIVYWVALKGGQYKVGTFNQATATGAQAVTGVGFQPSGLMLASLNRVTSSSITQGDVNRSLGFASGSAARAAVYDGSKDAVNPENTSQNLDRTKVIKMYSVSGATPTLNASADFTSFDSGGFTLNWATADATAREIAYLAIGSSPPSATVSLSTRMALTGAGF